MENSISWFKDPGDCFVTKIKTEMATHKNVPIVFGFTDKNGDIKNIHGNVIDRIDKISIN